MKRALKADGPLFDLPGGAVKAAVGATFTSFRVSYASTNNVNAPSLIVPYQTDAAAYQVWAVFTQLNVPIFSEMNGIPFFRRLELEASWRHDQYSNVKGTSNPKLAFNWAPIDDLTIRGTWGTSFRAPTIGEYSLSASGVSGQNLDALAGDSHRCFDRLQGRTHICRRPDRGRGKSKALPATARRGARPPASPR